MKTDKPPDHTVSSAVPANVGLLLGALRLRTPQTKGWHKLSDADWQDLFVVLYLGKLAFFV